MDLIPTALPDVLLVRPDRHGDDRGFFSETFRQSWFGDRRWVQDNQSLSADRGTVRGLHYQRKPHAQAKIVRVSRGSIRDVAVDIRHGSPTFGQHVAVDLDAADGLQVFVPEGFAHGFVTLEPNTEVLYKVSAYYSPEHDEGILWSDPDLAIEWGIESDAGVVSDRDRLHPKLADAPRVFEYEGS